GFRALRINGHTARHNKRAGIVVDNVQIAARVGRKSGGKIGGKGCAKAAQVGENPLIREVQNVNGVIAALGGIDGTIASQSDSVVKTVRRLALAIVTVRIVDVGDETSRLCVDHGQRLVKSHVADNRVLTICRKNYVHG